MASDSQWIADLIGAHLQDPRYRAEVEAEVLDHLELAAADLEATGLSPEEARRQAEAAFGDPALIGRLLRNTPKGGDSFVKFTRIGGLSGILAGLFQVLAMFGYVFERNHLDPAPTSVSLRLASLVIFLIRIAPFPLFLLALAGTYAHLPGSRTQKRFLLTLQAAGVITALWGAILPNVAVFLSGFVMMNAGTVWTGILLATRKPKPNWMLSAAMVVAGLGLIPSPPRFTALMRFGEAQGYTIGLIAAIAWVLIGFTLLAASSDQPNASVHGTD